MTPAHGTAPYRFADLTLDVAQRRVMRQGHPIDLTGLNFDLLCFLVESAPNVVTYDDVAKKVWGRHFVSPENVAQRVMLLRQALSEDASRPRYIEAVRGRGYRLICAVNTSSSQDVETGPRRPRSRGRIVELSLIGMLVVVVAWVVYRVEFTANTVIAPVSRGVLPSSVAVLPLVNLSPEPGKASVAAGLHEEILNRLTKVRALNVIAANSVLPYTQHPPPIAEIARTLRVQSIMTGSVRFAGGRIRVTMELVEAETGTHLWSDTYERDFDDIFAIESDIASNVAHALEAELSSDEQDQLLRGASAKSFEAYELYLAALGFERERSREGSVRTSAALELLDRALRIDPAFVDAWVAKANLHSIRVGLVAEAAEEEGKAAIEAASRAIEIDSSAWRAHAILSFVLANQGDWLRAEAESRRALELGMPISQAAGSGVRMEVGNFAAARDMFQESLRVDPMNSIGAGFLLAMHEMVGDAVARRADYERGEVLYSDWLGDAIELLLRLGDRDVDFLRRQDFSIDSAYVFGSDRLIHLTGQRHLDAPEAGLEALRDLYADESNASAGSLIRLAAWAAYFGDPEFALQAMSKATRQQPSRVWYLWLPVFEDARGRPEFKALIRDLRLVDYWREYGWPDFCRPTDGDDFECNKALKSVG
jgi:TolB-like protein/DNA-binding winged helix-turn-helix (wHTH) protein